MDEAGNMELSENESKMFLGEEEESSKSSSDSDDDETIARIRKAHYAQSAAMNKKRRLPPKSRQMTNKRKMEAVKDFHKFTKKLRQDMGINIKSLMNRKMLEYCDFTSEESKSDSDGLSEEEFTVNPEAVQELDHGDDSYIDPETGDIVENKKTVHEEEAQAHCSNGQPEEPKTLSINDLINAGDLDLSKSDEIGEVEASEFVSEKTAEELLGIEKDDTNDSEKPEVKNDNTENPEGNKDQDEPPNDDEKKPVNPSALNIRRNIREVMDEKQLDASTLAAQRQESERLARVQEQQRIIREVQKQIALNRQNKVHQKTLQLLQGGSSILKNLPNTVLMKVSDAKKAAAKQLDTTKLPKPTTSTDVMVKGKAEKKDVVEIVDSSSGDESTSSSSDSDDCIMLSDSEVPASPEPDDDPTNSGLHVNDTYNVPDDQGRVLINLGHKENEEDIFLAPQIARIIKPHQIGGLRFLFDNIIESVERFSTSTGFGCILAHSMGLGKTLQIVSFCDIFLRHTESKTVLCIMPINTLQNWVAEFNKWLPVDAATSPLSAQGEVRTRNFPIYVLNDSHKTLQMRAKVVKDWSTTGGVLMIGYELYRLLSMKKDKKPRKKKKADPKDKEKDKDDKKSEKSDVGNGDAHMNDVSKAADDAKDDDADPDEKKEDNINDEDKKLLNDMYSALVKPGPDLVICDEGHRIKNSHSNISYALKQMRTKRRIVLTGYPLQNNLLEYWCMVDFVRPNYLGSKTEFCNMFERPIQNGQCIDSTPQDIRLMRYRAHVLHSLLVGFVQRRSHAVLQSTLPQKEEYVLLIRMTSLQRELYDRFMNEVVRLASVPNPLKAFAICCKIWNHPDVLFNFLRKRSEANALLEEDLDLEEIRGQTKGKNNTNAKKPRKKPGPKPKGTPKKPAATIPPNTSCPPKPMENKNSFDNPPMVANGQPYNNAPGQPLPYSSYPVHQNQNAPYFPQNQSFNNYSNNYYPPQTPEAQNNFSNQPYPAENPNTNYNQNYWNNGQYYNDPNYYNGPPPYPNNQQEFRNNQLPEYNPTSNYPNNYNTPAIEPNYGTDNPPRYNEGYQQQYPPNQYNQQPYPGYNPHFNQQSNSYPPYENYQYPPSNYNEYNPNPNSTYPNQPGNILPNQIIPKTEPVPKIEPQAFDIKQEIKQEPQPYNYQKTEQYAQESLLNSQPPEYPLNDLKAEVDNAGSPITTWPITESIKLEHDRLADLKAEAKTESRSESDGEVKIEDLDTKKIKTESKKELLKKSNVLPDDKSKKPDVPAQSETDDDDPKKIKKGKEKKEKRPKGKTKGRGRKDRKNSKDKKDGSDSETSEKEEKLNREEELALTKKAEEVTYDWATELLKDYVPGLIENSAKMELFFYILNESIRLGDRILLFSQSLFTLNLIEDFLERNYVPGTNSRWERNTNYYRLDGSTHALEREKLINEFNANPHVYLFLVSTRAGSLGINLVGANRVIVFDASWNPCHDTQAVCRVYRYGQKKPCFVYRFVMDCCLEKKIYDRQINKQGMADRVVDECNPDAILSMKEITNLCIDNDEKEPEIKDLSEHKDKYIDVIIQGIITLLGPKLSKEPFQHESLLVDRKEKKLSSAEKRLAQRGYELEKKAALAPKPSPLYRTVRNPDGSLVQRPVGTVRPMQHGPRWIPADVWRRQGMTAQEMTLPLDVVIPTNSTEKTNIVLKAGQRVMVLKSPKGIYMQLESGKIIAIKTSLKGLANKQGDLKDAGKKVIGGRPAGAALPSALKNNSAITVTSKNQRPGMQRIMGRPNLANRMVRPSISGQKAEIRKVGGVEMRPFANKKMFQRPKTGQPGRDLMVTKLVKKVNQDKPTVSDTHILDSEEEKESTPVKENENSSKTDSKVKENTESKSAKESDKPVVLTTDEQLPSESALDKSVPIETPPPQEVHNDQLASRLSSEELDTRNDNTSRHNTKINPLKNYRHQRLPNRPVESSLSQLEKTASQIERKEGLPDFKKNLDDITQSYSPGTEERPTHKPRKKKSPAKAELPDDVAKTNMPHSVSNLLGSDNKGNMPLSQRPPHNAYSKPFPEHPMGEFHPPVPDPTLRSQVPSVPSYSNASQEAPPYNQYPPGYGYGGVYPNPNPYYPGYPPTPSPYPTYDPNYAQNYPPPSQPPHDGYLPPNPQW